MPKRQQRSAEVATLIAEIVKVGKAMSPSINAGELAERVGISPETLSRMKTRGSGDIAVVSNLAAVVGLQLKLSKSENEKDKILKGEFFDD